MFNIIQLKDLNVLFVKNHLEEDPASKPTFELIPEKNNLNVKLFHAINASLKKVTWKHIINVISGN